MNDEEQQENMKRNYSEVLPSLLKWRSTTKTARMPSFLLNDASKRSLGYTTPQLGECVVRLDSGRDETVAGERLWGKYSRSFTQTPNFKHAFMVWG
ncbi:hypothetical protein V6N11_036722 [Hibiscus sabdariffa]|uniref:Uncharacterized protein n=1 Tax=Hibiscus sabdariffa TaxID=183260 RepID=A0ABR2RBS5_9ROSI